MEKIDLKPGDTLCKQGDLSTEIYILLEGGLDVCTRDKRGRDKVISHISGKLSIFGEIGALLKRPRGSTLRASRDSVVQKVDTRMKSLDETILAQPRLGLSISMNLARYLTDTNVRLSQYTQFLAALRKFVDDALLYYYQKSKSLGDLYEQTHASWVKAIFDKAKSHVCYSMGETLSRGQEPVADETPPPPETNPPPPEIPSDKADERQFQAGDVLGREGEEGREIFILESGLLEIQVGGRKVSEAKDKGSVLGEVAVLAGYATKKFEKRSATILAREPSTAIVIDAKKLETAIAANPQIILFITKVLSNRLPGTNHAFVSDDERIAKYLTLLDVSGYNDKTVIHAYELLRTNLHSTAKDKAETQGYVEEVQAKLAEMKDRAAEFHDGYEELTKRWKPI